MHNAGDKKDEDETLEKMGGVSRRQEPAIQFLWWGRGCLGQDQVGVSSCYHKLNPKALPLETSHIRRKCADLFPVTVTKAQGDRLIKSVGILACGFGPVIACH